MKKHLFAIMAAAFLILLFAGCSYTQMRDFDDMPAVSPGAPVDNDEEAEGTEEAGAYFNPYNRSVVSDGADVYYCATDGIYKILNGESGEEKIVDGEHIFYITAHNNWIYYTDNGQLCRVSKDGAKRTVFHNAASSGTVACLGDTLYVSSSTGDGLCVYTADIASDPDTLVFTEHPRGYPAPNGFFYSRESIAGQEGGCDLFRISPDTDEAILIYRDNVSYFRYLITDREIFYCDNEDIYRMSLNGKHPIKFIDYPDIGYLPLRFFNFDAEYLYVYFRDEGLCRMNRVTGETEAVSFPANPGASDVVDGYLYGYDNRVRVRKKLPDGALEYAPFA
ncbi:MAG: DUF5050 domain-containing protein [Clostridiaceae bacterium]|nr:DUF5050 domain-containing protein [Eubacteriales bacterium]